jgi:hypothetical protein
MRHHPIDARLLAPLAISRRYGVLALVSLPLLALTLVGCGADTSAGNLRTSTSTSTSTSTPATGLDTQACAGPLGSVSDAGTPGLLLTPASVSGQAHVGDLIQVRLPMTNRWDFNPGSSGLAPLQPAAVRDMTSKACFWNFRGQSTQDVKLSFMQTALCAANSPCPLYARQVTFTVHIVKAS